MTSEITKIPNWEDQLNSIDLNLDICEEMSTNECKKLITEIRKSLKILYFTLKNN